MKSKSPAIETKNPLPKSGDYVYCPCCKGKGHVFDSVIIAFFVIGWILALFEFNNPNGISREQCARCEGKGFVKVPS